MGGRGLRGGQQRVERERVKMSKQVRGQCLDWPWKTMGIHVDTGLDTGFVSHGNLTSGEAQKHVSPSLLVSSWVLCSR